MQYLLRATWVGVVAFFIFVVNALSYNPSGDNRYYASEIICLNPKSSHLCTEMSTPDVQVFSAEGATVIGQQNMRASYVSETFARVVGFTFHKSDTYRYVLLKLFATKALFAGVLLALTFYLSVRDEQVHSMMIRLSAGFFSMPFLLEFGASVYPAAIALIGMLLCVLVGTSLREHAASRQDVYFLMALWLLGAFVVVFNRFDTAAFLVIWTVLWWIQGFFKSKPNIERTRISLLLTAGLALVIGFNLVVNETSREVWQQAVNREIKVVPHEIFSRSEELVERTGLPNDFSFTVMAPITMFDNGTRAFVNRTYGPLFSVWDNGDHKNLSLTFLTVILALFAWIPIILMSFSFWYQAWSRLRTRETNRQRVATLIVLISPIVIFFTVPWYVRGIWSLPYVLPLFLAVSLSDDRMRPLHKHEGWAYWIMVANNALAIAAIKLNHGELSLFGHRFPAVVVALVSLIATALFFVGISRRPRIVRTKYGTQEVT